MTEPLVVLWGTILFGAPVVTFTYAFQGHRVSPKVAKWLGGVAVFAFAMSYTPLSFPGNTLDSVALALVWAGMCVAAGALPDDSFQRSMAMMVLLLLAFPGCFAVALGGPPNFVQTQKMGCGHRVRFESWGWVAHSGMEAVMLWQPEWAPFEVERARQRFDDRQYPMIYTDRPLEAVASDSCGIEILYDDRTIWSYR